MPFYQFPGTDFHDLNLDWLLQQMKACLAEWTETKGEWDETKEDWTELQEYVQNYFANLDVSEEISAKIDAMVSDGTLLAVIQSTVQSASATAAGTWLSEHVSPETGYVLDSTMSVNNAAANAKAVGNRLAAELETDKLISSRLSAIDGQIMIDANCFELGTMYVASYPFAYYNSTTRIRTKQNNKIYLPAGVFIGVKNSGYTFFIGYEADDETHGYTTGRTADYQTPKAGYYSIVLYKTAEETITNINDYIEQLIIHYPRPQWDNISIVDRVRTLMTEVNTYGLFELGNINMSGSYPAYANSTSRVRTRRQTYMRMTKGDFMLIDENAGIKFLYSYYDENHTYHQSGSWSTAKTFVIPATGYYFFLFVYTTEATITNIADITDNVVFYRQISRDSLMMDMNMFRKYHTFVRGVAHRGMSSLYPENTALAYKMAAKYGFDCVETDVRYTSDGVPVCLHDQTINRTARNSDGTSIGETVNISDITYEQALEYDFGVWKNPMFEGTKILSFDNFIKMCKWLGITPYVELKVSNVSDLITIVKKYSMESHVVWISYNENLLGSVKEALPGARLGLILEALTSGDIAKIIALRTDTNEVFADLLLTACTDANVALLQENGIPLEAYTANVMEDFTNLNSYVTGITSNTTPAQIQMRKWTFNGFINWLTETMTDY